MGKHETGAAVGRGERPLSPHLSVYKLPLTGILSILHRITGVALALGGFLIVIWFMGVASGPAGHAAVNQLLMSWAGLFLLFGFSLALFYHLCNGIRHLFWDAGAGFQVERLKAQGLAVLLSAAALTAITWIGGLL